MRRRKGLALGLALAVVLVFGLAPAATAQTLDGKWFKVNCQCFTKAVNTLTGDWTTENFSFNFYIHFAYSGVGILPNGALYDYEIWSQVAPSLWSMTSSGTGRPSSAYSEHFFPHFEMVLVAPSGVSLACYNTPFVSASPNIFRSGGEIIDGKDTQGRRLYGWILLKGQLANSLPFNPI